jgi:dTDP-4-amino-4,6-dideoxygalactose transaminase
VPDERRGSRRDDWTAGRQRNAVRYTARFAAAGDRIGVPVERAGYRHIFNQYVIRVRDRDGLRSRLSERRVGTEIYYPVPLHLQGCFAYLGHRGGDFPCAEAAALESLALPIYPELTAAQHDHVARTVLEWVGRD